MTKAWSRVMSGVAAHFYSQVVTVVTQLASVPLFLSYWSPQQYGRWVMISAIPIYLTIADFGILTAAGNLMTMHQARSDFDKVDQVFRSCLMATTLVLPALAVVASLILFIFDFGLIPDERVALLALTMAALLTVGCGLFDVIYRPFGLYPRMTVLLTTVRIVEWLGVACGLCFVGTVSAAALGFLAGRAASCLVLYVMARIDVPQLHWTVRNVSWSLVRDLARGGFSFLSFPLGNLLMLQGMVILVGGKLGEVAVAEFSASRTITRMLAQLSILSGKAMAPEISAMYGAGKFTEAERLTKTMVWKILPVTVIGAVALWWIGPTVLALWSHGKIGFDRSMFTWLLLSTIATAFWQVQSVRLTATNRHGFISSIFLSVSVCATLAAFFGMDEFGNDSAAIATFLAESAMVVGTWFALRHWRKRDQIRQCASSSPS